jgi:hypothetical protein
MVQIGGIVSVGGGIAGGGGGGGSGIISINGATGPAVQIIGVSGVSTVTSGNIILVGGESVAGGGGIVEQSGVLGVNGIVVHQIGGDFIVDGAALSGLITGASGCHTEFFGPTTSGFFTHNLGTRNLVVQVIDNGSPPAWILPDKIIYDTLDAISVLFNAPQTGRVVILSCGGTSAATSRRVEMGLEFKEAFGGDTFSEITRVSGVITEVNIWQTSSKVNKLFTKVINRVSGEITQVVLTCDQSASTLITDITRVSGVITEVTKTFTP